jgi:hypothetical protein
MGIIIAYSALTIGGWMILLFIFIFYILLVVNKNFKLVLNLLFFSFSFFLVAFSLGSSSYQYFSKFFFSLTSYYPYVSDWSTMMFEKGLPNIDNFWKNINYYEYLKKHFLWGLINLFKFHLMVFPTFAFPLSFITIPAVILAAYKLKFNGLVLLIFTVLYFFGISFGSYAGQGQLYPRHFLVFLAPVSILLGYGLILIYDKVIKYEIIKNKVKILLKYKILILIIPTLITIGGIQTKASFWERDSSHFYNFGDKIKKITNENDVIMLASTVPDGWCATRRSFVQDVAFYDNPKSKYRINQEVEKYKVGYLLIDLSDHIYQRGGRSIEQVIKSYSTLNLSEILKDEVNKYYFYKILD